MMDTQTLAIAVILFIISFTAILSLDLFNPLTHRDQMLWLGFFSAATFVAASIALFRAL